MLEVMALEDGVLVKKQAILGRGAAVMAADNTWPVVFFGMAVTVMLMLSTRKGVRAFRFALSYTNLWFLEKRTITGHFRVRVNSFSSSSVGSDRFVTTNRPGELFSKELVKEDEEGDGNEQQQSNAACVNSNADHIVGTEMVFINGNMSSMFATGNKATPSSTEFCAGYFVDAKSVDERESVLFRNVVELQQPDSGIKGAGRVLERAGAEPKWPWSPLEPLHIVSCEVLPLGILMRRNARAKTREHHYPWDVDMTLRLRTHHSTSYCKIPCTDDQSTSSVRSAVVRGATHTATLSKNVVKFWENRSRCAVVSMPTEVKYSSISALDVDWERETAFLGSSKGILSVWDLERVKCVSSVDCHNGVSINILRSLRNSSTVSVNHGLILTAGGPSSEDHSVCLWDSRMLVEAAAAMDSPTCDEFELNGFELVARDCFDSTSVHDIRMLKSSSPVSCTSALEDFTSNRSLGRTGCSSVQVQRLGSDEQWWDVGEDSDLVQVQVDDFCDDDWEKVVGDMEIMEDCSPPYSTSNSPGVLSRCFSVISSTLAG